MGVRKTLENLREKVGLAQPCNKSRKAETTTILHLSPICDQINAMQTMVSTDMIMEGHHAMFDDSNICEKLRGQRLPLSTHKLPRYPEPKSYTPAASFPHQAPEPRPRRRNTCPASLSSEGFVSLNPAQKLVTPLQTISHAHRKAANTRRRKSASSTEGNQRSPAAAPRGRWLFKPVHTKRVRFVVDPYLYETHDGCVYDRRPVDMVEAVATLDMYVELMTYKLTEMLVHEASLKNTNKHLARLDDNSYGIMVGKLQAILNNADEPLSD